MVLTLWYREWDLRITHHNSRDWTLLCSWSCLCILMFCTRTIHSVVTIFGWISIWGKWPILYRVEVIRCFFDVTIRFRWWLKKLAPKYKEIKPPQKGFDLFLYYCWCLPISGWNEVGWLSGKFFRANEWTTPNSSKSPSISSVSISSHTTKRERARDENGVCLFHNGSCLARGFSSHIV